MRNRSIAASSASARAALLGAATCALAFAPGARAADPAPPPAPAGHYVNPVVRGMNPDPSICRVGGDYYLVTSSFHLVPGCPLYHSRDLVNWRPIGHALTRPPHFFLDRNGGKPMMFAATLRCHAGTFYVVTTDVNGGGNFYVTAKDPAGPWSDPIVVDKGVFDPSLFFDDDGKVYYTRRGEWRDRDILQAEIDVATGKLRGPLRSIAKGMVSDDAEGPHLYKIGGVYYLSLAEGGARNLHMQTIGRARSPWGPFEPNPGNPFIAQHRGHGHEVRGPGHADLIDTPDGSWWAVFLATRTPDYEGFSVIGRETFLAPVRWVRGWPVVDPQHLRTRRIAAPTLPLAPWPAPPARDDFDGSALGYAWVRVAYPHEPADSLTERKGFLRLRGRPHAPALGRQAAFVGRRVEDLTFSATTRLEFAPRAPREEAGLTVFQTDDFQYTLVKTRRVGRDVVFLRRKVGGVTDESAPVEVGRGPALLRVEGDRERFRFSVARDGGAWSPVGVGPARLIATEVAGGWAGALLGLYATGGGQEARSPADFDYFDYAAGR